MKVYSEEQKKKALNLYDQSKSITKVIQRLGYPTRRTLYDWIATRDAPLKKRPPREKCNNTPNHLRHLL